MYFCDKCQKEVVMYSIPVGAADPSDIDDMVSKAEAEGKLVLLNPPPFEDYKCPMCFSVLTSK
ncbi:MAG: hypothetical protein ACTSUE_20615 [Promethearchaeota archaeon]